MPELLVQLLDSGWIAAIAVAFLWLETAFLYLVVGRRRRLDGSFLTNALAGSLLLAALGASLADFGVGWIAGLLGAGLVAHLADLRVRLAASREPLRD